MSDIRKLLNTLDRLDERQNKPELDAIIDQYVRSGMTLQDLQSLEQAAAEFQYTGSGFLGSLGSAARSIGSNENFRVNYVLYHAGEKLGLSHGLIGTDGKLRELNGTTYTNRRLFANDATDRNIAIRQAQLNILPQRTQTQMSIPQGGAGENGQPLGRSPEATLYQQRNERGALSNHNFNGRDDYPYVDTDVNGSLYRGYYRIRGREEWLANLYPDATIMRPDGTGPLRPTSTISAPGPEVNLGQDGDGQARPGDDYRTSLRAFAAAPENRGLKNNPEATGAIRDLHNFLNGIGLPIDTDGTYGTNTVESVKRLQRAFKAAGIDEDIDDDGDVGPITIAAIETYRNDMRTILNLVSNLPEGIVLKSAISRMLIEADEPSLNDDDLRNLNSLLVKYQSFWTTVSGNEQFTGNPFVNSLNKARRYVTQPANVERLRGMGVAQNDIITPIPGEAPASVSSVSADAPASVSSVSADAPASVSAELPAINWPEDFAFPEGDLPRKINNNRWIGEDERTLSNDRKIKYRWIVDIDNQENGTMYNLRWVRGETADGPRMVVVEHTDVRLEENDILSGTTQTGGEVRRSRLSVSTLESLLNLFKTELNTNTATQPEQAQIDPNQPIEASSLQGKTEAEIQEILTTQQTRANELLQKLNAVSDSVIRNVTLDTLYEALLTEGTLTGQEARQLQIHVRNIMLLLEHANGLQSNVPGSQGISNELRQQIETSRQFLETVPDQFKSETAIDPETYGQQPSSDGVEWIPSSTPNGMIDGYVMYEKRVDGVRVFTFGPENGDIVDNQFRRPVEAIAAATEHQRRATIAATGEDDQAAPVSGVAAQSAEGDWGWVNFEIHSVRNATYKFRVPEDKVEQAQRWATIGLIRPESYLYMRQNTRRGTASSGWMVSKTGGFNDGKPVDDRQDAVVQRLVAFLRPRGIDARGGLGVDLEPLNTEGEEILDLWNRANAAVNWNDGLLQDGFNRITTRDQLLSLLYQWRRRNNGDDLLNDLEDAWTVQDETIGIINRKLEEFNIPRRLQP